MKIWGKHHDSIEQIDDVPAKDAGYTVREYRIAFGPGWTIWAGLKRDCPDTFQDNNTLRREVYGGPR